MTEAAAAPRLALGFFVVWFSAVACAGLIGIWVTAGGIALVLGTFALATDASGCREALRPRWAPMGIGLAVGVAMAVGTYGAYRVLAQWAPFVVRDTAQLYAAFRAPSTLVGSVALTPIILGEELVWRHVVQQALAARFGRWPGVVAAALAYAAALLPLGSPAMLLAALGCGLVWSGLRCVTRGLIAPVVAHLVWDAVVLVWLPLDAR